jgi:hypothetical protein
VDFPLQADETAEKGRQEESAEDAQFVVVLQLMQPIHE